MSDKTTISIDKEVRDELKSIGTKGEDYESIIKRNITFTKKFDDELQFSKWIFDNYNLLGFDSVVAWNKHKFPDFIMIKDGKEVRVEVETLSSNFIIHRHNPKEVDLVLCLVKNKEIPVRTIEISPFELTQKTQSITVSVNTFELFKNFKGFLKDIKPNDGVTSDIIIASLIKNSPYYSNMVEYIKKNKALIEEINREYDLKPMEK